MPATASSSARADAGRSAIGRALVIRDVLPRHQEVETLAAELHGHLQVLLPAIGAAGIGQAAIAHAEPRHGPGPGLQSAAGYAELLVLGCRWALRPLTREGTAFRCPVPTPAAERSKRFLPTAAVSSRPSCACPRQCVRMEVPYAR
ncbi:DUF6415 family natural product biosynthesis protein [Streptomyces fenghuangensis]